VTEELRYLEPGSRQFAQNCKARGHSVINPLDWLPACLPACRVRFSKRPKLFGRLTFSTGYVSANDIDFHVV
jgi:hypothetical protein